MGKRESERRRIHGHFANAACRQKVVSLNRILVQPRRYHPSIAPILIGFLVDEWYGKGCIFPVSVVPVPPESFFV